MGSRNPPRHVAAYESVAFEQRNHTVHIESKFNDGAEPLALVAWAGNSLLSEVPIQRAAGRAGAESKFTADLDLLAVLQAWNRLDWTDTELAAGDLEDEDVVHIEQPMTAKEVESEEQGTQQESDNASNPGVEEPGRHAGFVTLTWRFAGEASVLPRGASRLTLKDDPNGALVTRASLKEQLADESLPGDAVVTYHRGIGRYRTTSTGLREGTVTEDEGSVRPFINRRGYVVLAMNRELKPGIQTVVHEITTTNGIMKLHGIARSRHSRISAARLLVIGRKEGRTFAGEAIFDLDPVRTAEDFGRGHYGFRASLDFGTVDWSQLDNSENYDLWWEFSLVETDAIHRLRVNKTPYAVRATTRSGVLSRGGKSLVVNPYYTFKAKATSLILEVVDTQAFSVLKNFSPAADALARRGRKPIWLVGELPYKAQDNGLHFFRYLRAQHPEVDAYYVIEKDSPELRNLAGLDHVVFFGSPEHFEVALRADQFIGTHHADFLFPTRHPDFKRKAHGQRVFLQHGVMGTKWMVPNYGKRATGFSTDLFLVSSPREREYIVKDFGYAPEETAITGLPRFDALLAQDVPVHPKQVLVIPTWRDWLQSAEVFEDSEYLQTWSDFLHSPELAAMVREQGLEVVFCLHPNMQRFRHYFDDAPARIVSQGEVDVQLLMKQSAAMVTDYSSVGFDFSFLERPVLYLQFDRSRFLGRKGSHLDLDRELPGHITDTVPELLGQLQAVVARGFTMTDDARRRSQRFLAFRDRNNCERVFAAITTFRRHRRTLSAVGSTEFIDRAGNKMRRSRYYFPAMKAMQGLVRRLPMRDGLMVFESGLGKQYADSPRYIYEELLRRGDTRPKVWIYSGKHHFADPHTVVVKRLSPAYFWHLARANFWITNQNLPFYMTRRRAATYLQTWHGTPLKHMLHDLTEIHGRDEGYMQRVDRAISQWTHLISPSPYATEVMRSAFAYDGPVVEEGYPRNDVFFGDDVEERTLDVKDRLGLDPEAKVVLYAPTFRDNASNGRGRFTFELPFDLEKFNERFGEETILLLRMHVLVSSAVRIPPELRGRIMNVSSYPEIQELYLVSDVLVTDYSSVFFDFAALGRPIVFYAYDLELYRDTLRGFYLDYLQELPGPVVQTEGELHEALAVALSGQGNDGGKLVDFVRRFSPRDDGNASARVVDSVLGSRSRRQP